MYNYLPAVISAWY